MSAGLILAFVWIVGLLLILALHYALWWIPVCIPRPQTLTRVLWGAWALGAVIVLVVASVLLMRSTHGLFTAHDGQSLCLQMEALAQSVNAPIKIHCDYGHPL